MLALNGGVTHSHLVRDGGSGQCRMECLAFGINGQQNTVSVFVSSGRDVAERLKSLCCFVRRVSFQVLSCTSCAFCTLRCGLGVGAPGLVQLLLYSIFLFLFPRRVVAMLVAGRTIYLLQFFNTCGCSKRPLLHSSLRSGVLNPGYVRRDAFSSRSYYALRCDLDSLPLSS